MNVPRVLLVCLVAVGLVAASFAALDFGVREGETTSESTFVANAVNDSAARFDEGLTLHVRGDLSGRVSSALVAAFEARGVAVTTSETLERQYEGNVLVVTVDGVLRAGGYPVP
jgi:uncharacterized membrane protein